MRTALGIVALLVTACYREYQPATTPPDIQPEPIYVQGPPGGQMDPDSAYAYGPASGAGGYETQSEFGVEPSADAGYYVGTVTDVEIDATLDPYGYWVDDPTYGRIWRPHATVVGVDFTPYETCGTWVWTEYGWTFVCDWDWGWLPFHYGYWDWFDDYWAWVPDYTWSPAQVDWRYGGGYVGWRPTRPSPGIRDHRGPRHDRGPHVRDHRNPDRGPRIRDHRRPRSGDSDWRFMATTDLGKRRIRPALVHAAEPLRVTSTVARPPIRPELGARKPVRVADVMRSRLAVRDRLGGNRDDRARPSPQRPAIDRAPTTGRQLPYRNPPTYTRPGVDGRYNGRYGVQPGARPGVDGRYNGRYGVQPGARPGVDGRYDGRYGVQPGARPGIDRAPSQPRPTYTPPSRTFDRAPTHSPSRPTYTPPSRPTYSPPSRPTYSPPSRPTYSPPSRSTYSPPSRSTYSPPSRSTYSPPSRSTYSPPSRSSAPSRSYSPSSSSSSSSRGSSSYSAPSRSYSSGSSGSSRSSGSSGSVRRR